MDMIGKIRRMSLREGLSHSAIAKTTGLSRNTVKKWLKGVLVEAPKYVRARRPGKLTAFEPALVQALQADARRPKRDRRTAKALFTQIQAQGYKGGHTLVSDFTRAWRLKAGQGDAARAFVPLRFEAGEAYQFDWSEEGLVVGSISWPWLG